jgi:hypothetical protein
LILNQERHLTAQQTVTQKLLGLPWTVRPWVLHNLAPTNLQNVPQFLVRPTVHLIHFATQSQVGTTMAQLMVLQRLSDLLWVLHNQGQANLQSAPQCQVVPLR